MERLNEFILQNAPYAHWYIFGAILLAGANIPICIDLIILASALLAAQVIPEHTVLLFLSVWAGSLLSAWVAYWMGRLLGPKLYRWRWFSGLLNPARLQKIKHFYEKYGLFCLLIGRFIPFGVRNGIFMTTGMSRLSFGKFVLRDSLACTLWSSISFYLFYTIGQNYEALSNYVKAFNLLIFAAFGVTVIAFFWYKKRKSSKSNRVNDVP
jgi:membrane-associated protein